MVWNRGAIQRIKLKLISIISLQLPDNEGFNIENMIPIITRKTYQLS